MNKKIKKLASVIRCILKTTLLLALYAFPLSFFFPVLYVVFLELYTEILKSTELPPHKIMAVVTSAFFITLVVLIIMLWRNKNNLNDVEFHYKSRITSLDFAHNKEIESQCRKHNYEIKAVTSELNKKHKDEIRSFILKSDLQKSKHNREIKDMTLECNSRCKKYEKEIKAITSELNRQNTCINYLFRHGELFSNSASAAADMKAWMFEDWRHYLVHKNPPAVRSAEAVSDLKSKVRIIEKEKKLMQYKYEFLLSTFPELRRYVDDEETLISLSDEEDFDDFKANRDVTRDYLSDEEWKSLSVDERGQLALDRYMQKGNKSKWTVGMLYEMYIGHYFKEKGFCVYQNGLEKGLEDLGRDVIAYKKNSKGGDDIYVIQCKNWASNKEIHENVVCQIFGSAIEFEIQNKNGLFSQNDIVIPVICTTAPLSKTAMAFANKLGVKVYVIKMGDFPVIKCNINNGNKIYHLPFDQQYWRTQISNVGEFYAWNVAEATSKGFRRAMRHQVAKAN